MTASPLDRVYLTGFMGSGKSTVAPHLARLLGFHFVDLDAEIERDTGKTVPEIFSQAGEAGFRSLERAALLGTIQLEKVVVSLGGGTLTLVENELFVRSSGVLVYLRVDFESLFSRLHEERGRPLLPNKPGQTPDELRRTMEKLFAGREPAYTRADLVVDAGEPDPATIASTIAAALPTIAGKPGPGPVTP